MNCKYFYSKCNLHLQWIHTPTEERRNNRIKTKAAATVLRDFVMGSPAVNTDFFHGRHQELSRGEHDFQSKDNFFVFVHK